MRSIPPLRSLSTLAAWSPRWIALGLTLLVATIYWPAMPATTGMALIAVGATGATLARFARSPGVQPLLLLHLTIYGGLYALCVGARIDLWMKDGASWRIPILVDLTASVWPAAAAFYLAASSLIRRPSAD